MSQINRYTVIPDREGGIAQLGKPVCCERS
jgi:hypothetical protein